MSNNQFNSKYGFDLGNISNIEISGISSIDDKILVVKHDVGSGNFYLNPVIYSPSAPGGGGIPEANQFVLKSANGKSYYKKLIFNSVMAPCAPASPITINILNFSVSSSTYITLKMDLIGQSLDAGVLNYYHFTTGYNLVGKITGSQKSFRHIPGHFSYIINPSASTMTCVGPEAQFQNYASLPDIDTLMLQPKFSTITDPLSVNYPKIILEQKNTNFSDFSLTTKANSIKSITTETITWFGTIEMFASIV